MTVHHLQAQAIAKYKQLVRAGMSPQDAKDIFAPINEFLYDYIAAHGKLPAGLGDTDTLELFPKQADNRYGE